ncbi:uncharacterized protein BO80DRAFT_86066 [Aspergillus ibericus CBS 121593]|uniref:Uncharacterized protein n=1 Tax=Aspergillus ibericus CBS 121593 TaxID=1448316 RepID=A0A395HE94_9EURO|nr:hypothetical protein BO80DRAFT_86066 [Aspergillus ibericus CBS 121593]RAL05986.1 hypothetical protein BO80DRAFT_86066 [Aspergillus ibericus CBS 121593]
MMTVVGVLRNPTRRKESIVGNLRGAVFGGTLGCQASPRTNRIEHFSGSSPLALGSSWLVELGWLLLLAGWLAQAIYLQHRATTPFSVPNWSVLSPAGNLVQVPPVLATSLDQGNRSGFS